VTGEAKSRLIKQWLSDEGCERVGIAPAEPLERGAYLSRWLALGRAGSMSYLHRNQEIRRNPGLILEGARTVIVAALNYHQRPPSPSSDGASRGRVAMYAWGDDYHKLFKRKLFRVADRMRTEFSESFETRVCVDTAPIVERELAMAAGVGWIGKNTLVLNATLGSYFFLGEIVTTLDLPFDEPALDHCGSCTRCLDACPTNAFPAPYEMDASKCISYLTIEHRGEIAESLQAEMGDWVFGCDVCQEVCPFNRDAPTSSHFATRSPNPDPDIDELLNNSDDAMTAWRRGSAISRAKPEMLLRNLRIARNNQAGC
jgi:epoxyqueuosine reductase